MSASADVDVLVVGAGLAGLATAWLLHRAGERVAVLEAQDRVGGRILSLRDPAGSYVADLGPTWVWTPYQPVAERWLRELGLEVFEQYEDGLGVYEARQGVSPVQGHIPGQHGSMRVVGGSQAIIDGLVCRLPAGTVRTSSPVTAIRAGGDTVQAVVGEDPSRAVHARRVAVAMPARMAVHTLQWRPDLPPPVRRALAAIPTWMAPHGKAIVQYPQAFWRQQGLSGRLVSRVGPLAEAHDHCGPGGVPAALFGFVAWPPALRAQRGSRALAAAIEAQLLRCFGNGAPAPLAIHLHDWATDAYIATAADLAEPMAHPTVTPEVVREAHFDGRLWFCSSETAARSPGLIEGAFHAAERTAAAITRGV
jgi:monoamine oxidase